LRTPAEFAGLRPLVPEEGLGYVLEAIRLARRELEDRVPLIGFAGAPWTLASYMIEGAGSKNFALAKRLLVEDPGRAHGLLSRLAKAVGTFLKAQVAAGAQAVQLFDSWAGAVSPDDYRRYVMPYSARVLAAAGELGVPRIHFGVGTGELLGLMGEAGADVVGVDWRVPLAEGVRRAGLRAVQGNLDPSLVFAPTEVMLARATEVVEAGRAAPGHIFNLGHGVLPSTDPDQLARLTEHVQGLPVYQGMQEI